MTSGPKRYTLRRFPHWLAHRGQPRWARAVRRDVDLAPEPHRGVVAMSDLTCCKETICCDFCEEPTYYHIDNGAGRFHVCQDHVDMAMELGAALWEGSKYNRRKNLR